MEPARAVIAAIRPSPSGVPVSASVRTLGSVPISRGLDRARVARSELLLERDVQVAECLELVRTAERAGVDGA
jgi:hypothetical protein